MEEFSKNGRKLRPRKAAGERTSYRSEGPAYSTSRDFKRDDNHRSARPAYSSERPYQRGSRNSEGSSSRGEYRREGYTQPRHDRNRDDYRSRTEGASSYSHRPRRDYHSRPETAEGAPAHQPREASAYNRPHRAPARGAAPHSGFRGKPGRKPMRPKMTFSSRAADEGISRMISRRPQVSDEQAFTGSSTVNIPVQEEIRLNKFIANSGVCSRREADTLIQAGVVTVNGEVVTELGTKVNVFNDDIRFNGERLKGEEKVYLVMNKPRGFVTTASDPHAEKTVMELLKGCPYRVFPVGRLDKNTTGVLMFTNDGEIAERLTHPSYDKKKIYQVNLDKPLADEDREKLLEGVTLTDGPVKADELEFIDAEDHRKIGIEIHSGKNRIVRRLFESLGYDVKGLDRVYFAGLTKKGLKKGQWRRLSEAEVNILKMGAYV